MEFLCRHIFAAGGPAKVFLVMTNLFVSVHMIVHLALRVAC